MGRWVLLNSSFSFVLAFIAMRSRCLPVCMCGCEHVHAVHVYVCVFVVFSLCFRCVLSPPRQNWSPIPVPWPSRASHASFTLGDGVYIAGGAQRNGSRSNTSYLNDVWVWTPNTGAWSQVGGAAVGDGSVWSPR